MNMKADIFVPTSNRIDALEQCLESLSKQSRRDFRVLLVGLRKDENVEKLITKFPQIEIEYFIQKKKGLIGAANEALQVAENEIFVRIDDDSIHDEFWYENIIKTFESDEKIGGVTGPTVMSEAGVKSRDLTAYLEKFKNSRNPFLRAFYSLYNDYLYENKMYEVSQFLKSGVFTLGSNFKEASNLPASIEVNNLEACNWSARTALLRQIGGFDEIYVKGLGDYHEADAALKIKKTGHVLIFNPKVKLRHNVEVGTVDKARPAPYWRIQNFIIFYFRFFDIESIGQFVRFLTNVLLQNGYYVFRFFTTGKLSQLGALTGTFVGFAKVLCKYKN